MEIPSLGDQYNLKWNNHLANFAQTFIDHQNGESLVDVTLSCEGQYIKAHKLILSACSDYFHSIFQVHETLQHPIILLNGVRFIDLKYILHFMYHGEVKVVDNDLPNVLALGETLHIKGLSSVKLRNKHSEESSFPTIGASKKSNKDFSQNEAQFSTQYIPPPLCHVSSDVNGKKLAPDKVNESLINKPEVQAKTLEKAIINKIPISESQAVLNNARKTSTNNGNQSPDSRNPSTKMTRAPHAFMIFAKEWRKKLTIEHPEENNKEISVRLGNMWKNLLPETRNIYYKAARMAEEEQKNKCSEFVSETKKRKAAHDPINSPSTSVDPMYILEIQEEISICNTGF